VHIAEGFLPPAHAVGWTVAAAPFVVHGVGAVVREVRENRRVLQARPDDLLGDDDLLARRDRADATVPA
jgi:hypothetical protein